MGKTHIEPFLSHLATQGQMSASTQRQALNAIIFLCSQVLDQSVEDWFEPVKAKRHFHPSAGSGYGSEHTLRSEWKGLMGHADVKITEIYTHIMGKDISVVSSPLDSMSQ